MSTAISHAAECTDTLDSVVADWLQAKGSVSGTSRTRATYQEMLGGYRAELQRVGLDLDSEPAEIAPVAQRWAATRMSAIKTRPTRCAISVGRVVFILVKSPYAHLRRWVL